MALVETTVEGPIVVATLNRPDARNALSVEMCDALVEALDAIDGLQEARAIVLRGAGSTFCAGADFAAVSGPAGTDFLPAFERMLEAVARHRLPTIAAIHGAALGGGFQLASVCDFRVAADDARIGIPSSRLGILVNFENVRRLVLLAGIAVAKEVLLTSRTYTGPEAASAGLVHRSVPADGVHAAAMELADEIASLAPLSVQGSKRAIQVIADDLSNARNRALGPVSEIDDLVAQAYASADLQEGIAAMREKRSPRFRGE